MKVPNGELAFIDIRKIHDYCLSDEHPRGKHKARVFAVTLGVTANESETLRLALQRAARFREAKQGSSDEYGNRYIIDFELEHKSRRAIVRSTSIVRSGEDIPRFVICFVL